MTHHPRLGAADTRPEPAPTVNRTQETDMTEPTTHQTAPTAWIDGHPQLEAIANAVWEQCERGGNSTVFDDPRNIAVAAYAAIAAVPADRAALIAATARACAEHLRDRYADTWTADAARSLELNAARIERGEPTALLRRMAAEARGAQQDQAHACGNCEGIDPDSCLNNPDRPADTGPKPRRGDAFEAWLKAQRDEHPRPSHAWFMVDCVLDTYRLHADTGTPLSEHVCEGQAVGDCERLEQPAAAQQPKEAAPAVPQCDGCGHLVHRARKCPAVRYGERCECDEPITNDEEA